MKTELPAVRNEIEPLLISHCFPCHSLAGAGVKAGTSYGRSDDWGYQAAEGKTYCYDFHATVLHLMGIDHKRLVYRPKRSRPSLDRCA